MEEVRLAQTSVKGHRPKERMLAVMGDSEVFLQANIDTDIASKQDPSSQLQAFIDPHFAMPLATKSTNLASAPRGLRQRVDRPAPVYFVSPGNIIPLEVQIGETGAQMDEVRLPQTLMRGHCPRERRPALMEESEEFLQFYTQQSFQILARDRMPPLKEESEEFLRAYTQGYVPEKGDTTLTASVHFVHNWLSATQKRNLPLWNSSPGQKVGV